MSPVTSAVNAGFAAEPRIDPSEPSALTTLAAARNRLVSAPQTIVPAAGRFTNAPVFNDPAIVSESSVFRLSAAKRYRFVSPAHTSSDAEPRTRSSPTVRSAPTDTLPEKSWAIIVSTVIVALPAVLNAVVSVSVNDCPVVSDPIVTP